MDRNQAIGFALIAIMFVLYIQFFSETPTTEDQLVQDTTLVATSPVITQEVPVEQVAISDSVNNEFLIEKFGIFAAAGAGEETIEVLENDQLRVEFSTKGAQPGQVILKEFKTYSGDQLDLIEPSRSKASWRFTDLQNRTIDLANLYYKVSSKTDSSIVFEAPVEGGKKVKITYSLNNTNYTIHSTIKMEGLENSLASIGTFEWNDRMKHQEHDVTVSRNNTFINFYTVSEDFDYTSQRSTSLEEETIAEPVKWFSLKHKFFSAGIIADNSFSNGYVSTNVDPNDSTTVKIGKIKAQVASSDFFTKEGAGFTYFFGPNDYDILKSVGNNFSKNLALGWPPVNLVNRFVIIPLFDILSSFISNYGIIIIIMVLIIKLVLSPLSYKSYLSMAKMKVLKPELDEIKARNTDKDGNSDMTKVQQEQMALYRQVGVNPVSGCIPMVLQMPILFAMFYFFPQSIHLRQKAFLWASDLSTYDSIMTLPFPIPGYGDHVSLFVLLMTLSTILYTWSNNQMSSVQGPMKAMTYAMPVIFLFVLNSFPAALSFYYFVSNLVTFGQQAIIRRFVDDGKIRAILEDNKKNSSSRKKSKFMTKLEEAMKASEQNQKGKKK